MKVVGRVGNSFLTENQFPHRLAGHPGRSIAISVNEEHDRLASLSCQLHNGQFADGASLGTLAGLDLCPPSPGTIFRFFLFGLLKPGENLDGLPLDDRQRSPNEATTTSPSSSPQSRVKRNNGNHRNDS